MIFYPLSYIINSMINNELNIIKDFIEELDKDNSRLYKQSILEKYKDNYVVRSFLHFVYNPYTTTGISSKKASTIFELTCYKDYNIFHNLNSLFIYLEGNNTGTYKVLSELANLFDSLESESSKDILIKIITKNFKLGIDALTINKILGNIIPQFNIQLAETFFDHPDKVDGNREFCLTTKIDGGRIIALKERGEVTFFTRAGQPYEGLIDIEEELKNIPYDNFALDGEITLLDKGKLTSKDQYKQTMKIVRKDGEKHGVKILAFDLLPIEDFKSQLTSIPYIERRNRLESNFSNLTYITILPVLYRGNDKNKIYQILDEQVNKGEEGIMINFSDAPYRFKRSYDLLKCKKMHDLDLPIVGFEEGEGRNKGRLGAILVNYKNNIVKVGGGYTDSLRDSIWKNRDNLLGVTVAVKYFEETTNDKGGISLRFPVFIDFRFDK